MAARVLVGMSGGVDSSAAALLLLQQGYEVHGATLLLKPQDDGRDVTDAKAVCRVLGIPHIVLDFREDFRREVMDYFVEEYLHGRTPNPCVQCNATIKFGKLLDYALQNGFAYIATGHYAICRQVGEQFSLLRADSSKDQSYALYRLTQTQLAHILFPLTAYSKEEIRQIAMQAGLPVAHKADSQEVCFIPDHDYVHFVETAAPDRIPQPGDFLDTDGKVLGKHAGIHKYTIGQRKGLGITFGEPRYVTAIRAADNTVVLGPNGSQYCRSFTVSHVHFIRPPASTAAFTAWVKVRYQDTPAPALVTPLPDGRLRIDPETPRRSVTPGQSAVLYLGDVVLGGGTID